MDRVPAVDGSASPPAGRERRVRSGDLWLSVREYGDASAGRPHVVLVHGFPDDQTVWDDVVAHLGRDDLHLVTYDVRGAGASDTPGSTHGYRTELLVEDLVAVVTETVPDGSVHLVGHDWGSIQLWDVVAAEGHDPRLRGRVASFVSVSGPSLDHMADLLRHPRGLRTRLARQLARWWYVSLFQVPVLPEVAWRRCPRLGKNAANGVHLYRANIARRMLRPRSWRTDVPVLALVPRRDRFVTDVTVERLEERCSRLVVERPDTGHWIQVSDPALLGDILLEHVRSLR